MLDSVKINNEVFCEFICNYKVEFCKLIITTLDRNEKENECYYVKRGTLIFIEKILLTSTFNNFKLFYTNYIENLKSVMKQLNNRNSKIVQQAVEVLYHFFVDLESKDKSVKFILHANAQNFYKFFEKHEDIMTPEVVEKKELILSELKYLEEHFG
jgi:hypothetical protein